MTGGDLYATGFDPYVYPGTSTLRNHFDILDPAQLRVVEGNITALKIAALDQQRLPGNYDLDHLQAFHRAIFSDIYPWAGEIRSIYISRTIMFAPPENIRSYLSQQLQELAAENLLCSLGKQLFADRLTHYISEVNAVHPFREGNGRAQRAFFSQLARDAGYEIAWNRLDADRNIAASAASLRGDDTELRALLGELIEPRPPN